MLILVATPIGNLSDISQNAIDQLQKCDYILCEDTRHSLPFLNHFNIKKPLVSYHKFNERRVLDPILEDLRSGKTLCLISDAGTPCISDPGSILVDACRKQNLRVTICPGPSAPACAVALSGFFSEKHQFIGFLPKQESARKDTLIDALHYDGITLFFESPKRVVKTLALLAEISADSSIFIARELTKKHEECYRGSCQEAAKHFSTPPKGEIVLCLLPDPVHNEQRWSCISETEHVQYLEKTFSLPKKDAIKLAAQMRGIKKQDLYKRFV